MESFHCFSSEPFSPDAAQSRASSGQTPVIPLPDPGEGGPVAPDIGGTPVIPLPNPGEGGPVAPGGGIGMVPGWPRWSSIRFLNAARSYPPFRIFIGSTLAVRSLEFTAVSSYRRMASGYRSVTVSGQDGYIYLQKTLPFQDNAPVTVAVVQTAGGLALVPISDVCCPPTGALSNFRMSNLAYNSQPLDLLLADGRVVYTDVQFKETTYFKQIRPGTYQFYLAETNLLPMPSYLDIETMDSAFIGVAPPFSALASLQLEAAPRSTYTLYVLSGGSGSNEIQTLVVTDR